MPSMNANRRFNSIARRIQRSWQWKKLWQIFILNLLALVAALAAYLYAQETAVTGAFAGWDLPRSLTLDASLSGRAALRKGVRRQAASHVLSAGPLTLDADRYTAAWDGHPIELTHREFTLLKVLMENQGIVMSRNSLMERVWGYDYMGETNIVDVYVRYLRGKIDDIYGVKLIHTVRGVGYVLREG